MNSRYGYVIIDDNDIDRIVLNLFLKEYSFLECKAILSSPKAGLDYFANNKADLLFLDIEMPQMTGIDFQKKVKDRINCTVITTSHSEFALDGFEIDALDYILKPISKEKINKCLKKVKKQLDALYKCFLYENGFKEKNIMLKTGSSYVHIDPEDIMYLEAMKDYTKVVLLNKKCVTIHGNIGTTLRDSKFTDFVRIHKSYAIRLSSIQSIKTGSVNLSTGVSLPLGNRYKKELSKFID